MQKSKLMVCECDRNMTGFPSIEITLDAGRGLDGRRKTVALKYVMPCSCVWRCRGYCRLGYVYPSSCSWCSYAALPCHARLEPEDYLLHFFNDFRYKCAVGLQVRGGALPEHSGPIVIRLVADAPHPEAQLAH